MYQYSLFRHVSIHTNTSKKISDPQYKCTGVGWGVREAGWKHE